MVGDKVKQMMILNKAEKDVVPEDSIKAAREHAADLEGSSPSGMKKLES